MRLIVAAMLAVGAMGSWAAADGVGATTREAGTEIIKLTVHAVATTRPALMYHLLPEVTEQTPGDAAQLYQTACLLLRDKFGDSDFDKIDYYLGMPLDQLPEESGIKEVDLDSAAVRSAHLAARREDVKWDMAFRQEGMNAPLPYLNDMRSLGRHIELKARVRMARKDWGGAIDALQDGFSMTRQLSDGSVLVQALVAAGIENLMLDETQEWISQPQAPNLYWALSDLPQPCMDLHHCMEMERAMLDYTFPHLAEADKGAASTEQSREILQEVMRLAEPSTARIARSGRFQTPPDVSGDVAALVAAAQANAREQLIQWGMAKEKVDAMSAEQAVTFFFLRQYREFADEAYKGWELPNWQAGETMSRIEVNTQKEISAAAEKTHNPFLSLIPSLNRTRIIFLRIDRRIAVLRMIEMLRDYAHGHDGLPPERLDQITGMPIPVDPGTGKMFGYEAKGRTAIIDVPGDDVKPAGKRYELTFEN